MLETQAESALARFGVSIPADLAARLDRLATDAGISRNALISRALTNFVDGVANFDGQALIAEALRHALDLHRDELAELRTEREGLHAIAKGLAVDADEAKAELDRLLSIKEAALSGKISLDEFRATRPRAAALATALDEIEAERALVNLRIAALENKEKTLRDSISSTARAKLAEAWAEAANVAAAAGQSFGAALAEVVRVALTIWPPRAEGGREARFILEFALWNAINAIAGADDTVPLRRAIRGCIKNIDAPHIHSSEALAKTLAAEMLPNATFPGVADAMKI